MELLIEQHQYIPDLENGAGVRICIHNQSNMPFPEDEGINIAPGRETFIGVHKVSLGLLFNLQTYVLEKLCSDFVKTSCNLLGPLHTKRLNRKLEEKINIKLA